MFCVSFRFGRVQSVKILGKKSDDVGDGSGAVHLTAACRRRRRPAWRRRRGCIRKRRWTPAARRPASEIDICRRTTTNPPPSVLVMAVTPAGISVTGPPDQGIRRMTDTTRPGQGLFERPATEHKEDTHRTSESLTSF